MNNRSGLWARARTVVNTVQAFQGSQTTQDQGITPSSTPRTGGSEQLSRLPHTHPGYIPYTAEEPFSSNQAGQYHQPPQEQAYQGYGNPGGYSQVYQQAPTNQGHYQQASSAPPQTPFPAPQPEQSTQFPDNGGYMQQQQQQPQGHGQFTPQAFDRSQTWASQQPSVGPGVKRTYTEPTMGVSQPGQFQSHSEYGAGGYNQAPQHNPSYGGYDSTQTQDPPAWDPNNDQQYQSNYQTTRGYPQRDSSHGEFDRDCPYCKEFQHFQ